MKHGIFIIIVGWFTLFYPPVVLAASYGDGAYGVCTYGIGCSDSSGGIVSVISSVVSSTGNAITTFFCTNQMPSSSPNLYQINVTGTTATLYFSPAGGPYDRHYISYGQGNTSEGHGVEIMTNKSNGALHYQINLLPSGTIYTFKVRGGNGCKPGPWSNTLTIRTQPKGSNALARFYPNKQAKYMMAKKSSWTTIIKNSITSVFPQSPNAGRGQENVSVSRIQQHKASKHRKTPSLWETIMDFLRW